MIVETLRHGKFGLPKSGKSLIDLPEDLVMKLERYLLQLRVQALHKVKTIVNTALLTQWHASYNLGVGEIATIILVKEFLNLLICYSFILNCGDNSNEGVAAGSLQAKPKNSDPAQRTGFSKSQ